jgi:hypothetical protein
MAALAALSLPALAAAQGTYDPYGRPDYRRDRDDNNRRNNGRQDFRQVRDSARRLENASDRLQKDLDRALDRSRVDGTRREDNINRLAREFHRAASDLKDRSDDGRNLNRTEDEARRVFDLASQIGRVIRRNALYDNRVANDWSQIQNELNIIGDAYGYRLNGNNNGRYNPRNNNNDDYGWRRWPN